MRAAAANTSESVGSTSAVTIQIMDGDLVGTEPGAFGSLADANRWRTLAPVVWVSFLTLRVVGPWLSSGYIFGPAFAGPRHYAFPNFPTSFAALQAALGLAAAALPADVVGKVLIVSIFLRAGLGAFFAVPVGPFIGRAADALVYMIEPLVYDRLAYGQLTVLAGYAVLPFVALAVRRLILGPDVRRAAVAAGILALVGILDIHLALIAAVLSGVLVGTFLALDNQIRDRAPRLGAFVLLAVVAPLVALSYWLIPM